MRIGFQKTYPGYGFYCSFLDFHFNVSYSRPYGLQLRLASGTRTLWYY